MRLHVLALAAILVPSLAAFSVAASVPSRGAQTITYFALGDSIASGHGLMDDGSYCRRSARAYPYLVQAKLQDRGLTIDFPAWHHLACSGARSLEPDAKTLKEDANKWLANQVDEVLKQLNRHPPDHPVLVSISIGANDLDWLNIPFDLARMAVTAEGFLNSVTAITGTGVPRGADEGTVRGAVTAQVRRLLTNPNVVVVLTQVHNPVNTVPPAWFSACNTIGTLTCYGRTDYATRSLNDALFEVWDVELTAIERQRVRITPGLHAAFETHKAPRPTCGDGPPDPEDSWIQYPGYPGSSARIDVPNTSITLSTDGDCFHPNDAGADAYAGSVVDATAKFLAPLGVPEGAAAPGTVLYESDWSGGPAGWTGAAGWKVRDRMLVFDDSPIGQPLPETPLDEVMAGQCGCWLYPPANLAVAPYLPSTADYAVEAEIQVVRAEVNSSISITARDGIATVAINGGNYAVPFVGMEEYPGYPFRPGTNWHTYRLEARGDTMRFLIDGVLALELPQRLLPAETGGHVGVTSQLHHINIRAFRVIAL